MGSESPRVSVTLQWTTLESLRENHTRQQVCDSECNDECTTMSVRRWNTVCSTSVLKVMLRCECCSQAYQPPVAWLASFSLLRQFIVVVYSGETLAVNGDIQRYTATEYNWIQRLNTATYSNDILRRYTAFSTTPAYSTISMRSIEIACPLGK